MTGRQVSAEAARRTLLLLTFTRWFPVGLTAGVSTLLAVERGMSLAQVAVIFSVQGFVLLGLAASFSLGRSRSDDQTQPAAHSPSPAAEAAETA